jgi:hypothetical protein
MKERVLAVAATNSTAPNEIYSEGEAIIPMLVGENPPPPVRYS